MNTRSFILLVIAALGLTACKNGIQKVEPQQLEYDSSVVVSDHPITDRLYAELDSSEVYNDSILYGYWFKPHEASAVNIFFHKDNTYEFKYYLVDKEDNIVDKSKNGRFIIKGEVITLDSDEGWNDYFNGVMYYKHNGTNFYLTDKEEGLYLVKGSD
jgi:hypothetical protein